MMYRSALIVRLRQSGRKLLDDDAAVSETNSQSCTHPRKATLINKGLKISQEIITESHSDKGKVGNCLPEKIQKFNMSANYSDATLKECSDSPEVQKEIKKPSEESQTPVKMPDFGISVTKFHPDLERLHKEIRRMNTDFDFDYCVPFGIPPKASCLDDCSNNENNILLRNGSKVGTIGLFVSGKDQKSGKTKCYAVTSAHCLLDKETTDSARDGDPGKLSAALSRLKQQIMDRQWTIRLYNHAAVNPVDAILEYRLNCLEKEYGNKAFAIDIALLELDESIASLGESSHLKTILEISTEKHLIRMIERQVNVFIGEANIAGRIRPFPVPYGQVTSDGIFSGLMVHVDAEVPLCKGQSGSAIKVKQKNETGYEVIGILYGRIINLKYPDNKVVYLGVVLHPNLQQIKSRYCIDDLNIAKSIPSSSNIPNEQRIDKQL